MADDDQSVRAGFEAVDLNSEGGTAEAQSVVPVSTTARAVELSRLMENSRAKEAVPCTQKWQLYVTRDTRDHMFRRLLHTHFYLTHLDSTLYLMDHLVPFISVAQDAEAQIYKTAESRIEYVKMIGAKEKEFQDLMVEDRRSKAFESMKKSEILRSEKDQSLGEQTEKVQNSPFKG